MPSLDRVSLFASAASGNAGQGPERCARLFIGAARVSKHRNRVHSSPAFRHTRAVGTRCTWCFAHHSFRSPRHRTHRAGDTFSRSATDVRTTGTAVRGVAGFRTRLGRRRPFSTRTVSVLPKQALRPFIIRNRSRVIY